MTGWQRPVAWVAELAGRFPGWECWKGTSGLLYARRCGTSGPPVHGENPTDLADAITAAEWSAPFLKHHHVHEAGRASFDAQVTRAGGLRLALAEQAGRPPGYREDDPVTVGRAADDRAVGGVEPSKGRGLMHPRMIEELAHQRLREARSAAQTRIQRGRDHLPRNSIRHRVGWALVDIGLRLASGAGHA